MFLDRSTLLPARSSARLGGVAVVETSGRFQFFVAGANGTNQLLSWSGATYRDIASPILADAPFDGRGAVAADFDGDGNEEIYLVNDAPGADRLFALRANGWIDLLAGSPKSAVTRSVAVLDRRGTGRYGFALAGNGGPLRLLESPERFALADLAPALGIDRPIAGGAALVAPLASQRSDLFVAAVRGSNALFRNTGLGTFLEVATEHGLHDDGEVSVAAAAFDDGEGGAGLIVANADGPHRLFVRRDDRTFKNVASPAMAFPSDARTVVVADFDNDGFEEIVFVNRTEPSRLFRRSPNAESWIFGDVGAMTDGVGATVADLDRDGRLELLVTRGEQEPRLFLGPKNGNAWLRVVPRTRFGAPARGATVRLTAGGRIQFRTICGGSGSLCQMEPVAHFGLGAVESVDRIEIAWPDGTVAQFENPNVRTTVEVRYPGA